jgi:hypothetical protein
MLERSRLRLYEPAADAEQQPISERPFGWLRWQSEHAERFPARDVLSMAPLVGELVKQLKAAGVTPWEAEQASLRLRGQTDRLERREHFNRLMESIRDLRG